jgi:hypothetical protein
MRKPRPITRNWPSPDELAAVDHGIRELVATLEPVETERVRQRREHVRPQIQRIMEAIFRTRSRARVVRLEPRYKRRSDGPDLVSTAP